MDQINNCKWIIEYLTWIDCGNFIEVPYTKKNSLLGNEIFFCCFFLFFQLIVLICLVFGTSLTSPPISFVDST